MSKSSGQGESPEVADNKVGISNPFGGHSSLLESVPLSISYYSYSNPSHSPDTAGMLNHNHPQYGNTSHPVSNTPVKYQDPFKSSPLKDNSGETRGTDEMFNQVPKRFSQFIIDQQNPYMAQRLDNLSLQSISMHSEDQHNPSKTKRSSSSGFAKYKPGNTGGQSPFSPSTHSISKMGSQATIFSTRDENERLFKWSRSKHSKSKSNNSGLSRSKAIRFKKGGWYYRLKFRLNRFIKKITALKFKNFTVSSKRTASIGRSRSNRKTLKKKYHKGGKHDIRSRLKTNEISVPYTNPYLGQGGTERVPTLDDALKYKAGAENLNGDTSDHSNKQIQMSDYIGQQQNTYINAMYTKNKSSSINYGNKHVAKDKPRKDTNSIDEIQEIPPTPPPHIEENQFSSGANGKENDVVPIWKSYLSHVLSQRIQLRNEIIFFQNLVAEQRLKSMDDEVDIDESSEDLDFEYESDTDSRSTMSEDEVETIAGSSSTTDTITQLPDIFVDPTIQKLNKAYNRKSVLGDMLDYNSSDNELSSSSVYSNLTSISAKHYESFMKRANSTASSNLGIGKRYGTILRRRNTASSKSRSLSYQHSAVSVSLIHAIRRSQGFQMGLSEVA